ncbi:hypothetical protein K461DRAFT_281450 [Myriangium duriaei CBS 260.36]|uniref:PA14 domain-containing protein n=1 Tax=Myriangium duriaei CBS 260.36 TaxID=1168546 RepID=A0A9P4J0M4_9PEZI|nr:hypothetical protein K461DRAFT_281450 [Myriangium duriaei CBS 260.36]
MLLSALIPALALASAVSATPVVEGRAAKVSTTKAATHTTVKVPSSSAKLPTHLSSTTRKTTSTSALPPPNTVSRSGSPPAASVSGFTVSAKPTAAGTSKVGLKINDGPPVTPNHSSAVAAAMTSLSRSDSVAYSKNFITVKASAVKAATTTTKKTTTTTSTKKSTTTTKAGTAAVKKATTSSKKSSTTTTTKKTSTTTKKSTTTTKATTLKHARRQQVKAVTTSTTTTTTTTSALQAGCTALEPSVPLVYNPLNTTIAGFWADAKYSTDALANVLPPAGYQTISTNGLGAVFATSDLNYLTMTQNLATYNTTQCARQCDAMAGCLAFNIYYQRGPQYTPSPSCLNPPPVTAIQCGFWGNYVNVSQATNTNTWRQQFGVVIAGSNIYWRYTPPASEASLGFKGPTPQTGALGVSSSKYISYGYMSTMNAATCANACLSLTASRRSISNSWYFFTGGVYTPCQSFNIFNLTQSGAVQSYVCVMYSDVAANSGTPSTTLTLGGVTYGTTYSYTYDLYPQDPGSISSTWSAAPQSTSASCDTLYAAGSTVTDYDGVTWNLACNYDVTGTTQTDLASVSAPDFYSCFDICNGITACDAFSFGWNTCFLKTVNSTTTASPYSNSNTDLAWKASSNYAGFSARAASTATVAATTLTQAWTGTYTTTITKFVGTAGTVIVQTPGTIAAASATTTASSVVLYYTGATDSGTATTIYTTTVAGPSVTTTIVNSNVKSTGTSTSVWATSTSTRVVVVGKTTSYTTYYTTSTATLYSTAYTSTTSYTTTSSILTVYPTPAACNGASLQGANYAFYANNYMGGQSTYGYPSFSPEAYKTINATKNGTTSYIAEDNDGANLQTIYGNANSDGTSMVIDNTFYVFAGRGSGYYTFQIPYADDITMIWIGSKAYSGWSRANNDLLQFWSGQAQTIISLSYYMTFGTYMPVRVMWANGGGAGSLQLNIWAPDGSFLLQNLGTGSNSAIMSQDIVTRPCNSALGAAFPSWGKEW